MIEELTHAYLAAVDEVLPGLVERLYVVGSGALGAWQPEMSDVDTIIVVSRELDESDLAFLNVIHAGMPEKPHLDGVYLDKEQFDAQPMAREVATFVVNGAFRTGKPCGELNPVVWSILQQYGITIRGPEPDVTVDQDAVMRYCLENLRDYWLPMAATLPDDLAGFEEDKTWDDVPWLILGPPRLHYTLASGGEIISKSRAGEYLARMLPQHRELAQKAVRWRSGDPELFTTKDLREAGECTTAIVEDAWKRFA